MAIKRGIAVDGQLLPNATGTLYSVPSGATRAVVTAVSVFANAVGNSNLFVVPNGGSAGNSTQVENKLLAAGEPFTAPNLIGQAIEAGGSIQGDDGAAGGAAVNIVITVTEFTGDS